MRFAGRQFHNQPEASHTHGFLVALWEEVAQRTDGALKISVHAQNGGIPGSDPAALEMLVSGELELMTLMGGILGQIVPVAEIQGLPFAFTSHEEVHAVMRGALGNYLRSEMAAKGIHGFREGVLENGFRHLVSIARPVLGAEDLAGYRMRIPAGRMFEVISKGKGNMGAYGSNVPVRDRWAIIAYVRALQTAKEAPYEAVKASFDAAKAAGQVK